jgi:hypothetical protein
MLASSLKILWKFEFTENASVLPRRVASRPPTDESAFCPQKRKIKRLILANKMQKYRIWNSHLCASEELYLLGHNAVNYCKIWPTFQRNIRLFDVRFMLVYRFSYSQALKIKVTCFYETSVDFYSTTRWYTPEDRTLEHMKGESLIYTLTTLFTGM